MGIAEGVMAGGSLLGGVLGSRGSSKAAKAQTNIAEAQQRMEDAQFQQSRSDQMPWLTTGRQALNQLSAMTHPGFDYRQLESDPGYQFRRQQGENALSRALASRGMLNSGAAMKEAARYSQGLASDEFTNAFNRLSALAGTGQTASGLASLGSQYMQSSGNNAGQLANARASAYAGQAQAQQNALSDILGMVGSGAFNGLFGGGKSIGNSGYGLKEKL